MLPSMKDLAKPPFLTLHLFSVLKELSAYTEDPAKLHSHSPTPPRDPFVNCSLYYPKPIEVSFYPPKVFPYLNSPEAHEGEKPVFDTKCYGWTVLKVPKFKMCMQQEGCDGVVFLHHNEKDGKAETKAKDCDTYVRFENYLRFRGFLRICEDKYKDQYILEGLLADGEGRTQTLYRVRVTEDSPDFVMYLMDLEQRVVIWAKDESILAKKSKNGGTVPETIVLEFPSELTYKLVASILCTRSPSRYRNFITNVEKDNGVSYVPATGGSNTFELKFQRLA